MIREGHQAYKIVYSKDDVAMNREVQVNNRILSIDPEQKRFVVPSNTYRIDLGALERNRPNLYNVFVSRCLESLDRPEFVYIGLMPVLQKLEHGLSGSQKAYVRDSIQLLHQAGISHNDIHRDNVMIHTVDGTNYPVIIDFGRAGPIGEPIQDDMSQFESFFVSAPPALKRRRRRDDDEDY